MLCTLRNMKNVKAYVSCKKELGENDFKKLIELLNKTTSVIKGVEND